MSTDILPDILPPLRPRLEIERALAVLRADSLDHALGPDSSFAAYFASAIAADALAWALGDNSGQPFALHLADVTARVTGQGG